MLVQFKVAPEVDSGKVSCLMRILFVRDQPMPHCLILYKQTLQDMFISLLWSSGLKELKLVTGLSV